MTTKILVTLGPNSLSKDFIEKCVAEGIYLFRINLSHTPIELVEGTIRYIQKAADIPICLDSEGAQLRNHSMANGSVVFKKNSIIKVSFDEVLGNENRISFSPRIVADQLEKGDRIRVDFDSVCLKIIEKKRDFYEAVVEQGGRVGSNKAADLDRELNLNPITEKDMKAIKIGKKLGINHFALSFANSGDDVKLMRELCGVDSHIISKIETRNSVLNLDSILQLTNEILIDRGDLSRNIRIEKIPFLQRRIISLSRSRGIPVFVATNLLESMVLTKNPTRAEVNDVVSTLIMGANGLVLAAETAIGKYPIESVKMIRRLIRQFERWTNNTSIAEILEDFKN